MGAKFCCCLPVRLGVLILSAIQSLLSGVLAAFCWFAFFNKSEQLTQKIKIGVVVLACVETLAALIAFGGFLGAIFKKQQGVRLYSWMLNFQFGFQLVFSIISLIFFYMESKAEFIKNCIDGSTDQTVIDNCNQTAGLSKPLVAAGVAVSLLIQLWFCWIVAAYAKQLRDRETVHTRAMMLDTSSEFKYEAARAHSEDTLRPLNAEGSYPYAHPSHSYGKSSFDV